MTKEQELFAMCQNFIKEQRISFPETIYQTDWVIENAYEFIERVCNIVGYLQEEDDE